MNIKSLLLGSAAALAAVSGAQAADAIVAAEPEPMEYVRVCDAFGAGFFYIPGTETCLKVGGYVRFQTNFGRDLSGTSDWDSFTRGQLEVDARSDTEYGALRGFIGLRGDADASASRGVNIDQAFIELGGLKVGYFYNWWDDGLSGETDVLGTNTLFNSARYTYDAGSFAVGLSVDELEGFNSSFLRVAAVTPTTVTFTRENDNNVGISGVVSAKFAGVSAQIVGGYDTDQEEGAVRGIFTADLGPGKLGLSGVYASGINAYYAESEWAVAAEYAIKATDRLTITPGFQYSWNVAAKGTLGSFGVVPAANSGLNTTSTYYLTNDWTNNNEWRAGLTVDYKITEGLTAKAAATYIDRDGRNEQWNGFLRLQRSF